MTDEPGRKPRRKATTEVGRQILQKERQRLAREAATLGEAMANEARAALNARTWERATVTPQRAAISRGIVRRVGAVLASEGVNVPITVRPTESDHESMSAWTDFRKIDVTYKDYEDKRLVAATLRGLLYHEGGHCRWSMPWATLCSLGKDVNGQRIIDTSAQSTYQRAWNCLEDQRMETAVVSDSPRKAAYLTPMIMTEHCRTVDAMAANYPLLVWRRYLPRHMRQQARKMFVKLHEDKGGEVIATELEAIVTSYVLATDVATMLQAVRAYHNLLTRMHPLASNMNDAGHSKQRYAAKRIERDDLEDFLTIPVSPDMTNETFGPEPEDDEVEDDSIDTTDPAVAKQLAEIMWPLWWTPWNIVLVRYVQGGGEPEAGEGDGQGGFGSLLDSQADTEGDEAEDNEPGEAADDETGSVGRDHVGSTDDEVEDDSLEDDEGDQDDSDEAGGGDDKGQGGHSGTHTDDGASNEDEPFTQDDLDELLQEAQDDMLGQRELDGDMQAYARESQNQDSKLDAYIGGISSDGAAISAAEALAEDIERSFTASTMDRAPAWVEGQRRGVLNVLRYETRSPGDAEVFRQWTEDEAPGYDIAVSVLLDYSSSMGTATSELAQAGYAAKRACDNLGIPCTVTLWDTSARNLWDANERAEALPVIAATGGTDPTQALADLDNQRCDRPKHVVLIMTDGDWTDGWPTAGGYGRKTKTTRHLAAYKDAGRLLVGFGYGSESLAEGLIAKGCDEAFGITDLMAIPHHLERILLRLA